MSGEDDVMRTEMRASLILLNYSCGHEAVTAAFGVASSRPWTVGDPLPSGRRPHKSKGWRLWSSLPLTATMKEHAIHLLDQLKPDPEKLAMLDPEVADLSFAVESWNGARPPLGLDRKMMARLVEMKLDLDIDLYVL